MTRAHHETQEDQEIAKEMICPITSEIMIDPVSTSDGHTYERYAIERWLREKNTSPNTGSSLENKKLTPNHPLRQMIDRRLTTEQKEARHLAYEAREKDPNSYDRQVLEYRFQSEKQFLLEQYPEYYGRLTDFYGYNEIATQPRLNIQELERILSQFVVFESLLTTTEIPFKDLLGMEVNARGFLLKNLDYLNNLVTNHHMPLSDYMRLDYESMLACTAVMEILCIFVQTKCASWSELLQLNQFEYSFIGTQRSFLIDIFKKFPEISFNFMRSIFYRVEQAEADPPEGFSFESGGTRFLRTEQYIISLFFSDPRNTDHLSLEELIAALKQSADVAVATFMDIDGNSDKLFGWISREDLSRIRKLASDGRKKLLTNKIPDPPGGIGATLIKPKTAADFENEMEWALGSLKGHALYYERTKADLPSLIHSLDDLKKVLKNLFPHQCKDVLETLRARWGQLIKTPNDLAQLLNYFNLEREDLGLLMDFEEKDFYPNVPYLGKGEGHSIKYAFLPSGQATARDGALIASDLPTLPDEQWANIEAGHVEAFELPPIFEALNQRGITFKNEIHMTVLEVLDKKVSGEECSFLQRLLPDRAHFEEALAALKPDRSTKDKAGLQQQIDTLQDFLRHAMQPYLHLTPYQPPERPSPVLQSSTHSAAAVAVLREETPEPQPRHWIREQQPFNHVELRRKIRSLSVYEFKQFLAGMDRADKERMVANCFSTLSDFTAFLSHSPLVIKPSSNDTHLKRCDLLYSALHESINKKIHSIHDLFEVSQYLSEESKRNLYAQNDKKIIIDKWRKGYPQPKDQYLMLLRASFGYLGYKDHHTKHQPEASLVTQVAAYFLVLLCAFPIQLMPNWIAQSEINMLRFFGSQRATFVMGLEENYSHQSERSPLTAS